MSVRLLRNRSPARRANKDVSWATDEYLREWDAQHRTVSGGDFPYPERRVLIDTIHYGPDEAAELIRAHLDLS